MKLQAMTLLLLAGFSTTAFAEKARFLYDDKEALQARADLIQQAKKEILVEYFSVTDDDVSTGGIALLCDASRRGVKVRILLDALSSKVKDTTIAATQQDCKDKNQQTNIEFRLFNPIDIQSIHDITKRVHDKMLVVDGKVMIMGGRNVDAKYFGLDKKRNFKDLDILIGGKIVQRARQYYIELWDKEDIVKKSWHDKFQREKFIAACEMVNGPDCERHVDEVYAVFKRDVKTSVQRLRGVTKTMREGRGYIKWNTGKDWLGDAKEVNGVRMLANATNMNVGSQNRMISDDLYSLFKQAKRKVLILSPYLIPTKRAKALFEELRNRGVSITIITNSLKSTDNLFAQAGYQTAKNTMIEMGIELYEYDLVHTTHAKTAVIDDEIALIGTYNLDPRSSKLNREIGLVIKDKMGSGIAGELTKIINKFKAQSLLVGKDGQKMNLQRQNSDVGVIKKGAVKTLEFSVPLIKHQL